MHLSEPVPKILALLCGELSNRALMTYLRCIIDCDLHRKVDDALQNGKRMGNLKSTPPIEMRDKPVGAPEVFEGQYPPTAKKKGRSEDLGHSSEATGYPLLTKSDNLVYEHPTCERWYQYFDMENACDTFIQRIDKN